MNKRFTSVNLISGPRNISTALMYSFAQRDDFSVIDEPFYAYYLKMSGKQHPGQEEILVSQSQHLQTVFQELEDEADKNGIFIKNMAHHMKYIPISWAKNYKNIFLIRDPSQLIASFTKVIPNPEMEDIGLAMELDFYNQLEELSGEEQLVIDSGEVLKNPEGVLKQLCKRLEIPWDEKMLTWDAGPRPEDGVWARHWYHSVHKSTRFSKPKSNDSVVPENCQELLEASIPIYKILFDKSIKA